MTNLDQDQEKIPILGPDRTRTNKVVKISDRSVPDPWRSVDPRIQTYSSNCRRTLITAVVIG